MFLRFEEGKDFLRGFIVSREYVFRDVLGDWFIGDKVLLRKVLIIY